MPINVFSILFFLVRIETLERNSTCLQAGEILANQSFLSLFWFYFSNYVSSVLHILYTLLLNRVLNTQLLVMWPCVYNECNI